MKVKITKTILIAIFSILNLAVAQAQVTRIITDFNGYYSSSSTSVNSVTPNNRHHLLGFTYNGVVYSTGVDDAKISANVPVFTPAQFRSVPLGFLPGTIQSSYYLVTGNAVDGNSAARVLTPELQAITTRDALTDGIRGLDIGTSITNMTSTVIFTVPVGNINSAAISDNAPDILFMNVGTPSANDVYEFLNADNIRVGNSVTVTVQSTSSPIVANMALDLYGYNFGESVNTALIGTGGQSGNREVRVAALRLSQFGITDANKEQVAYLRLTPGGGSDPSFIAYNEGSFSPRAVWQGDVSSDWNTPGNWFNNVMPNRNTDVLIPVVASPNVYPVMASGTSNAKNIIIAAGATVTVNGSGVLQLAGSIQNQGTFDVTDGSLAFIGTSAQTVPSGAFVENTVKNLTINATSVTLEGAVDLTGVLSMNAGTFNTGNFLTLKSDASGSAVIAPVTGNVSGEMTIERFIPARRAFRFLSSPVDGGTIRSNWQENGAEVPGFGTDITGAGGAANGFDATATNNPSLYTYWNTNPGTTTSWIAATTTNTPLLAGTPYRMLVRGDRTVNLASNTAEPTSTVLRSTGTIKTGDVVVTDLSGGADRFSLIGNPYQAPVDMDLVLQESTLIKNTFYTIWDPNVATRGAYVTVVFGSPEVNTVSGSLANRFLQPGQAAFVQGSDNGSAMITFKESHKNVGPVQAPVFRMSGTVATIRGTLYDAASLASNGSAADGFLVAFGDDYSNELNSLDAIKPGNQDENAGLMNSGKVLSYETRNYPVSTDVLPLSNTQYRSTNYTYRMTVSGLSDVTAMLLDKHTNTTYELANDESTDISFTVDANNPSSVAANRFDIIFGTALGNNDQVFANAVRLYPNPTESGSFSIQLPSAEPVKVTMTSILGQQVFEREFAATSNVLNIAPNQLQAGVYLVKVASANGTTIKKLIVK
ncbi:MAG: T9SS type A sorting domain-containing protein [Flavobacterium sp.]|nr:T9SS type A sorting domain-containing protein [Flavobacterium sp.]